MSINITNSHGKITYTDEYLSDIVGLCAVECYGIVGMSSKRAVDGVIEFLKGENLKKGVKITVENDDLNIDLFVVVEYGVSIAAVAKNVIHTVKYNVEKFTGLNVIDVNVVVDGIRINGEI